MSEPSPGTSVKILRNSVWIGIEAVAEAIVLLASSVAVARYLGPQKLGYFSYINFFVSVVTRTSGDGMASATRKYMAEFLAAGEEGKARAVYNFAYRYQLIGALLIMGIGVVGVSFLGDPAYRTMAILLMVAIVPGVMSWVPAQANNALEDASANTLSALAYIGVYAFSIALTIHFHWDLIGVAGSLLAGRSAEVLLRTFPLHRKLRRLPLTPLDTDTRVRIRRFFLQAFGIQLLMSVVWDRSEMVFLRAYSDLQQIAFYSVSFGLTNNLLMVPRVFGGAIGLTLMVESGRNVGRVNVIVRNACKYLCLAVFPIFLCAAAITRSAVQVVYGPKYLAAVPVLMIAALLAIPRGFQEIAEVLIKAADKQKNLLLWLAAMAVLNVGLDYALIPHHQAIGAALANGLAQGIGVMGIWWQARRIYHFQVPISSATRLLGASGLTAGAVYLIVRSLPGVPGLATAVVVALPMYIVLLRAFRGLDFSDGERLFSWGNRLPAGAQTAYSKVICFVTSAAQ